MEGKIFKDSANIYQDQAKVLYEYYKSAAERIVSEEKAIEAQIEDAKFQTEKYEADREKAKRERTIGWILCWTIVGLVFALMRNARVNQLTQQIDQEAARINSLQEQHKGIFRDYRVTKMGVAYVPVVKRVAYNDKSFIVDQGGVAHSEKFTLQVVKQADTLNDAVSDLKDLTENAPIVETSKEPETIDTGSFSRSIQKVNFNDYFGRLDRALRTITYSLRNVEEYNVDLPVVFPDTPYANFLKEHATTHASGAPVFKVFDTHLYDDEIDRFTELNEVRKSLSDQSGEMDKVLRGLMVNLADTVQSTASKRVLSAGSLVDYSNRILFNILKAPYNFYSPVLEANEIERIQNETFDYETVDYDYRPFNLRDSSKVKLDIRSMSWVAEDGSRTNIPFGISQIQSEIIAPIVTNLLKDTRKDRLAIYNQIKDQKLSYLTKWHQDTEDFYGRNRAEAADVINLMHSTLSKYSRDYNTLASYKETEASMRKSRSLESAVTEEKDRTEEVLAGYKGQAEQIQAAQKAFSEYMDRLQDEISERADKFGRVEYYDASLRDQKARDSAVAKENVKNLEQRRQSLASVDPLLAQEAKLPPQPSVDAIAYEVAGIDLNAIAKEALRQADTTQAPAIPTQEEAASAEATSEAPEIPAVPTQEEAASAEATGEAPEIPAIPTQEEATSAEATSEAPEIPAVPPVWTSSDSDTSEELEDDDEDVDDEDLDDEDVDDEDLDDEDDEDYDDEDLDESDPDAEPLN